MNYEVTDLTKHEDSRGFFYEILRSESVNAPFGQMFITSVAPNDVKGNHYHKRKLEWFCVIKGKVKFHLKNDSTQTEEKTKVNTVSMSDEKPQLIKIYPNVSHAISNEGDEEALVVGYISESYNSEDPDTFPLEVFKK